MSDWHRTRSGLLFNPLEFPSLPILREEKKDVPKDVPDKELFMSLYAGLKKVPPDMKAHVLTAHFLEWAGGFEPALRKKVDDVWLSYLHDYDFALKQQADAFVVARDMLRYQMPITDDAALLIKREELLRNLVKENPFKRSGKKKGKKSGGGGGGGKHAVVADAKEQKGHI
jgi:hypothetical protein